MGDAFRPADRIKDGRTWRHRSATFDLDGLDLATRVAVLRQWVVAPVLRAEIVGLSGSLQGFVKMHGGSINHLRNMLNGHRLADYATVALVTGMIEPSRLPDEEWVRKTMLDAFRRSDPSAAPRVPTRGSRYISDADAPTGPSARGEGSNVPQPHPDAALIRALFTHAVLGHPITLEYLASDRLVHPEDPTDLTVDVEVLVAHDDAGNAEGYIAGNTVSGTIWAPRDWTFVSLELCGGVVDGAFVLRAREGHSYDAIEVFVEAGDAPEDWDVSFRGGRCTRGADGGVIWDAVSQDSDTDPLPIHGRQEEGHE